MARKLSQNEFIERLIEIHGNKFDYSDTFYINTRTKISVICKNHGEFQILPDNHLKGQGCVKCAQENHKLTHINEKRLENLKKIHDNKYEYKNIQIIDGQIEIYCKEHGTFEQSIYNHERGHGCNLCNIDSRKVIKYRTCRCCGKAKNKSEYNSKFKTCKMCLEMRPIIDSKFCIKCNLDKPIVEFHLRNDLSQGYRNECISCYKSMKSISSKSYRQINKKKLREYDLDYRKERMKSDPLYRAKIDARNIIRRALSEKGYSKKSKTQEILGCSFIQFKEHIESLFLPSMSWNNRNEWHIDHIIPLSFAKSESELLLINHYSNLRPLWIVDNQLKSDNIELRTEIYDQILSIR